MNSRAGGAEASPRPRKLGRPPRVKALDTRRRILDIARGVYADRGYDAATNKEIADLAGMTTAALYYHFPSKRDLYLAVHDDARDQVYSRFEAVLDPAATFVEQLIKILDETHVLNDEDPTLAQFLAAARVDMRRRPELNDALENRAEHRNQFFARLVEIGVRTGEIKPQNRQLVAVFITAMMTGMTDALSDDQRVHAVAIDAVKAMLDGDLVQPVRPHRRRRAG
jgi:AcrR family transcriptional regulator